MCSNLRDTKYHENYPFIRFFKITVPNVVGYLKLHSHQGCQRLANQRLRLGRDEVFDWLDADSLGVNAALVADYKSSRSTVTTPPCYGGATPVHLLNELAWEKCESDRF
ncbi:hypothetical protein TNCV_827421 [Trichonephila clavipes]|nr:hypothetical protein TNCV_827421 [Trichonephila clavipes]